MTKVLSVASGDVIDLIDLLGDVRSMNHAIFMGASDPGVTSSCASAIKVVSDEIDQRISVIEEKLEEMMGGQSS